MIPLLVATALALAVDPADISTERRQPTTVWILPEALAYQGHTVYRSCTWQPEDHPELPAGLRAQAHTDVNDCGEPYLFLDLDVEVHRERRSKWVHTTLDAVSLKPPRKNRWDSVEPVGQAWARPASNKPVLAIPVDDPHWEHPIPLATGDPLDVLDPELQVVRTATGREVVVPPVRLAEEDPLVTGAEAPVRQLRARFLAGRVAREQGWALTGVPGSDQLLAAGERGRAYELQIHPDWLGGEVFEPAWLDPVEQVLDHDCDGRLDRGEPCGAYLVDYRPLGAWWPRREALVVVVHDGDRVVDGVRVPRLRVMVREPWSKHIEVAPEWDDAE